MAAKSGRGDAARGGGAGSRTRVRKCSTTGVYKLSSRFVVDAHAPTSGVGRLQSDWSFECVRRTSPTRHSAAFAPRSTPRKESWRNGARLLFRQRARIQHHHWHLYASSLIDAVTGTRGLQPGLLTLVETKTPPDSQRRCLQNQTPSPWAPGQAASRKASANVLSHLAAVGLGGYGQKNDGSASRAVSNVAMRSHPAPRAIS